MESAISWRGKCWSGDGRLHVFIKNLVELFDSKVCTYKTYVLLVKKKNGEIYRELERDWVQKIEPIANAEMCILFLKVSMELFLKSVGKNKKNSSFQNVVWESYKTFNTSRMQCMWTHPSINGHKW